MNGSARNSLFLFFFLGFSLFLAADDQQKAHKVIDKVTAMATDPAGRRAVNLALSQYLSVDRKVLVQRRRAMQLNYGDLFVAYQLVKSGTKLDDVAALVKSGRAVWQVAGEQHLDWKQIANEAKKLNGKVDDNLLKNFANKKSEAERDRADGYDSAFDSIAVDNEVSRQCIEEAQQRYMFLRDHAGTVTASTLDTSTERAAEQVRTDPVRTAGPIGSANPK
jgi:hypothetical protein